MIEPSINKPIIHQRRPQSFRITIVFADVTRAGLRTGMNTTPTVDYQLLSRRSASSGGRSEESIGMQPSRREFVTTSLAGVAGLCATGGLAEAHAGVTPAPQLPPEDGYRLWLRYQPVGERAGAYR